MTAAEYHQQQLEQQEWEDTAHGMNLNHGRFVGVARFIRDNAKGERDVQDAIKYLMSVLEDYEQLNRRAA
jgi:hypothetical protein